MGAIELEEVIPMKPKQIKRFYEPVVLFKALTMSMLSMATHSDLEESVPPEDPRQLFEAFVNKLSFVCDNIKGLMGATITSFTVLQCDDNSPVQYVFTSNRRTEAELCDTQDFAKNLLGLIGKLENSKTLLRYVLWNNRHIIRFFLQCLVKETQKCLDRCSEDLDQEDSVTPKLLREIIEALPDPKWMSEVGKPDYLISCEEVFKVLAKFEKSTASEKIIQMSRDIRSTGHNSSKDCWPEMLHMVNRILAYRHSIAFFLQAQKKFPELFRCFKVYFIPSSKPLTRDQFTRRKSYEAEGIVNRMTSNNREVEIFKQFVEELQIFDLDDRIRSEYEKDSFRPIVHSETHLHGWLDNTEGGLSESRFFRGWKYIGSSKPTCKLCHYYFEEHNSGVRHRVCHLNLYPNWRLPDVPKSAGLDGENKRQAIYNRVIRRIRKDAFDIVRKKTKPTYRVHDSNTFSARMTLEDDLTTTVSDVDDVSSLFGNLNIDR